jgi:hypothetical protein
MGEFVTVKWIPFRSSLLGIKNKKRTRKVAVGNVKRSIVTMPVAKDRPPGAAYETLHDTTRIRAMKIYRRQTQKSAIEFVDYV